MRPVILDVDTGYDDALALLLALRSPLLDVRGVTCVAGNQRLPQVITNTLKMMDILGADTPVAAGMDRPLIEDLREPALLHGRDGMADLGLPASTRKVVGVHAVELMRQVLAASSAPVTLIALAPLTNIATFLRMYPDLHNRIGEIVIMGGSAITYGNTSPLAEFNARQDPEATAIVLGSGLPIRLYPLDVFRKIRFDRAEIDGFAASADPVQQVAGRIMQHALAYFGAEWSLIGDAGAVATVIDPSGCRVQRLPVSVELTGTVTRGATIVDRRTSAQRARPNPWWQTSTSEIDVILDLDAEQYRRIFSKGISEGKAA